MALRIVALKEYPDPPAPTEPLGPHGASVCATVLGRWAAKPGFVPFATHTATVLSRPDGQPVLVDCGSGVVRNLVLSGVHPRTLAAVLITHTHADHVLELALLVALAARDRRGPPLRVIGPPFWDPMERFLSAVAWVARIPIEYEVAEPGATVRLGGLTWTAVRTNHVIDSVGWVGRHPDDPRVAAFLTGDTARSEKVVAAATGVPWCFTRPRSRTPWPSAQITTATAHRVLPPAPPPRVLRPSCSTTSTIRDTPGGSHSKLRHTTRAAAWRVCLTNTRWPRT